MQVNRRTRQQITHSLAAKSGFCLEIGPFSIRIHSGITSIADHIIEMYGGYMALDSAYADIHIELFRPLGFHYLFQKQVNFKFDDETPFKPLPYSHARPFFEWGLNWCIATTAHQYHIIHAAVVARGSRCALIPGRPGAGKSTLCAALVNSGWRLLSDEMALIAMDNGLILPIPRPISLKNNSIDLIRNRYSNAFLSPPFTDTHKGTVAHMRAPADSVAASHNPATATWLVFPGYKPGAQLEATRVSPCHAILRLADDSFNLPLLGGNGFNSLSKVASKCDAFELKYSSLDEAIAWFNQLAS